MGNYWATERKFGWIRASPASLLRHRVTVEPHPDLASTAVIDLRAKCPPVWDQGSLSACTAFAVNAAYSVNIDNTIQPSCLFLYYNERALEGTVEIDAGAILEDGYVVLKEIGVCVESKWPYIPSKFSLLPDPDTYTDAGNNKIIGYQNIAQTLEQIQSVLLNGKALSFGFVVYQSFMSINSSGIMSIPKPGESQLGGHAVTLVGYDMNREVFICRNSWGASWGDKGYFYMPISYALDNDYAGDYWVIE